MSKQFVEERLRDAGIHHADLSRVLDLLIWFGVLGIFLNDDEERYSYQYEQDPKRMAYGLTNFAYCVHPAFRVALGCIS
jgi:hypothetical protein